MHDHLYLPILANENLKVLEELEVLFCSASFPNTKSTPKKGSREDITAKLHALMCITCTTPTLKHIQM